MKIESEYKTTCIQANHCEYFIRLPLCIPMFALFVITMLFIHPMHKPCKSTLKQTVKKLEPKMTNHFIFRFNGKI